MELKRSDIPPWRSSPRSVQKRALLGKIRQAVQKDASYSGSLQKVVVNNFNILDPSVWVVANLKGRSGEQGRVLVSVGINSAGSGSAHVFWTHEATAENQDLIQRILAHGLKAP